MKTKTIEIDPHAVPQPGGPTKTLWLVAPPKTGSTWLSKLITRSLKWPTYSLLPRGYARRYQEIVFNAKLARSKFHAFLPHHHTPASETTLEIIKTYDMKVILLGRSFLDTARSLVDHVTQDGAGVPVGYFPLAYKNAPFEDRCKYVSELLMPWYISFYASWAYAAAEHKVPLLVLTYEELEADPISTISKCLTHIGEQRNIDVYNTALQSTKFTETRFNKGVIGRGNTLPEQIQKQLIKLWQCHKDPVIRGLLDRVDQNCSTMELGSPCSGPLSSSPLTLSPASDPPPTLEVVQEVQDYHI